MISKFSLKCLFPEILGAKQEVQLLHHPDANVSQDHLDPGNQIWGSKESDISKNMSYWRLELAAVSPG